MTAVQWWYKQAVTGMTEHQRHTGREQVMNPLVLKQFDISPQGQGNEHEIVHIVGRASGLQEFLLSLASIDPVTEMSVNHERVRIRQLSFFGMQDVWIPLTHITSVSSSHEKPKTSFALMWVTGFVTLLSSWYGWRNQAEGAIGFAFLMGLVCFMFACDYLYRRSMAIFVQNGGDTHYGLAFEPSVIESVKIEGAQVEEAVKCVRELMMQARKQEQGVLAQTARPAQSSTVELQDIHSM